MTEKTNSDFYDEHLKRYFNSINDVDIIIIRHYTSHSLFSCSFVPKYIFFL